ncbi:MAG TPA: acyl-CoA dehydrogenase family protein [Gordonia sp. (in: high G+C Gram-positive bacteria)]|uniref:acyl-CoA dehydrogenase family protein n=1 Tax=unclassified Gordonia (in: high G+C Gram-positive bacteria) TaxID=2657482 RepID=UPI000F9FA0C0|nr:MULTISPECIES: acyl-CoA dehydrogenase family protein [unclassified Gordonia (in: high G+C Gram-positive bacteria)]RUP37793.1 MAG: acyl-CoA dehydrogenase [Gordonia sp. (in: high G+C Gram-positive bacteria)]HNP55351.1 acyl-CoA dehydrogenase family protein [Gordonia sp. (in: high G+C Gram-positive bacteria)]HRC50077.1 acyl-CoA dehydrogenase family protein [Gordonia sp. (in: high G+C Gram-positive bacteria)]
MPSTVAPETAEYLTRLDEFIDAQIVPLQAADDNERFFDHRREWARTDFEGGGLPRREWEELLAEMKSRADRAGFLRHDLPVSVGGDASSNLEMAIIREHLAHRGLGLHNDLQDESSVVGNFPSVHLVLRFGTPEQIAEFGAPGVLGERTLAFGLTEPEHGSDATWMETTGTRSGDDWVITGEKRWNTGMHVATHDLVFARTSGSGGDPRGITAFIVPVRTPGVEIGLFRWTLNMPTDHADVKFDSVRVPDSAILGEEGRGLEIAQAFVHENRLRQAASSLGAAQYCIDQSVDYARTRETFGAPLATRQAVQWPLVELHTEATMLRSLIRETAADLDSVDHMELSDHVSMCNYRANRLVCDAADRAMQVHGGMGYSRHLPFEHIYRHHRRYRITEGAEEIQMRRVAGHLFGFTGGRKKG